MSSDSAHQGQADAEQRLNRIVHWMQTAGDPWMREQRHAYPQPDSDLALDDAAAPQTSLLSHYGIVMALDHLGAVVDAVVNAPPRRLKAHFTVLRTAFECGVRVCWLLQPDSSEARQLRAVQYRYENLEEQRKAINDLMGAGAGPTQDEQDKIAARYENVKSDLTSSALALGANKLCEPPDTISLIKELSTTDQREQSSYIQLWRTGSAFVRGHYWADEMRTDPGRFDYEWFQPTLQGAFLFITCAMTLRQQRSISHAAS